MALAPGTRLGPHEVVEPLGAGGMGEVYRARDPRLGRDVAVKVLAVSGTLMWAALAWWWVRLARWADAASDEGRLRLAASPSSS